MAEQNRAVMDGPFAQAPAERERGHWLPVLIGGAVIGLIIAAILTFWRNPQRPAGPVPEDPYSSNIRISELGLRDAHNLAGTRVVYVEGKIANLGSRTINGVQVETVFRNSMGQVVGRETGPLMLLQERTGYTDVVNLSNHPLAPNAEHEFRLIFEGLSADWNQGIPELRLVKVNTR